MKVYPTTVSTDPKPVGWNRVPHHVEIADGVLVPVTLRVGFFLRAYRWVFSFLGKLPHVLPW